MTKMKNFGRDASKIKEAIIFMKISDLKIYEPFNSLFPIVPSVLESIINDIRKNGYDKSKPIEVWKNGENIVIDGHTRLLASKRAGIQDIPVSENEFSDKIEALKYAISNRRNREDLTDADILRLFIILSKEIKSNKERAQSEAKKQYISEIGNIIGIAQYKVQQISTIIKNADEEAKKAILSGEKSNY